MGLLPVEVEEPNQQRNISACVEVLARLKFDENLIRQFLGEDIMRESPLYQEILQEGVQQGIQQGEVTLTLRQLTRRLGTVPPQLRSLASAAFNKSSRRSR